MKDVLALLDFDDTLVVSAINFWKNYVDFLAFLYSEIKTTKGEFPHTPTPTVDEALRTLEKFEAEHLPEWGYSPDRKEKTFTRVCETYGVEVTDDVLRQIIDFSNAPFDAEIEMSDDVKQALSRLISIATISIWTRGKQEIQSRRVKSVGLNDWIDCVHAFHDKSSENLRRVINAEQDAAISRWNESYKEIWLIGNSIEHDILPAIEVKVNAILVGGKGGSTSFFRSYSIVDTFPEAVDLILGNRPSDDETKTLTSMFR